MIATLNVSPWTVGWSRPFSHFFKFGWIKTFPPGVCTIAELLRWEKMLLIRNGHTICYSLFRQSRTKPLTALTGVVKACYITHADQKQLSRSKQISWSLSADKLDFAVKAKFHYASWFEAGSRSWSQTGSKLVGQISARTSFEPATEIEFGF